MDARQRRIVENERLFREVNERIREVNEASFVRPDDGEFLCECGDGCCTQQILVPMSDYEAVRAWPNRFLVRKGHVAADVERVVDERPAFDVVEKLVGPAEEAAAVDDRRP